MPENDPSTSDSAPPARRLMESGAEYLTDTDLVSLVIRPGPASTPLEVGRRLLESFGSLRALRRAGTAELCAVPGIGRAAACSLRAALELGRRALLPPAGCGVRLQSPAAVARRFEAVFAAAEQEEFHVVLLDAKNTLLGHRRVTVGLLDRSQIHPREVFRCAIRESAARILLVHNHPSGDPTPSKQDIDCTRELKAAGAIVGIEVVDHVILGRPGPFRARSWLSFREEKLL